MSLIYSLCLIYLPPWNGQDCSRVVASQPSPLRSDPFGATGLTDDLEAMLGLELYQSFALRELPISIKKTLAHFVEQYTQSDHQKLDHLEGGFMTVVSREDLITSEELIKESLEAAKLNLARERLEQTFLNDHPLACFSEDYNDINIVLDQLSNAKTLSKIAEVCKESHNRLVQFVDKYRDFFNGTQLTKLNRLADFLILWENLTYSMLNIREDLTEDSKLKTLISWSKCIGLLSEVVEHKSGIFTGEAKESVRKLAQKVLDATCTRNPKETKKSQYKRSLRNSARFILEQIETKQSQGWKLVVGKGSYQELMEESKRKIHLLDSLAPETEEEAIEQENTLRYLEQHLD